MQERRCLTLKGAFKRKTKSSDRSDGDKDEHAEDSTRKVSGEDLRGVEGAGGEEAQGALELVQRKHKMIKWEGERRGQGLCKGWRRQVQLVHGPEATTIPPLVLARLP